MSHCGCPDPRRCECEGAAPQSYHAHVMSLAMGPARQSAPPRSVSPAGVVLPGKTSTNDNVQVGDEVATQTGNAPLTGREQIRLADVIIGGLTNLAATLANGVAANTAANNNNAAVLAQLRRLGAQLPQDTTGTATPQQTNATQSQSDAQAAIAAAIAAREAERAQQQAALDRAAAEISKSTNQQNNNQEQQSNGWWADMPTRQKVMLGLGGAAVVGGGIWALSSSPRKGG